jgi:hypothetical protein
VNKSILQLQALSCVVYDTSQLIKKPPTPPTLPPSLTKDGRSFLLRQAAVGRIRIEELIPYTLCGAEVVHHLVRLQYAVVSTDCHAIAVGMSREGGTRRCDADMSRGGGPGRYHERKWKRRAEEMPREEWAKEMSYEDMESEMEGDVIRGNWSQ